MYDSYGITLHCWWCFMLNAARQSSPPFYVSIDLQLESVSPVSRLRCVDTVLSTVSISLARVSRCRSIKPPHALPSLAQKQAGSPTATSSSFCMSMARILQKQKKNYISALWWKCRQQLLYFLHNEVPYETVPEFLSVILLHFTVFQGEHMFFLLVSSKLFFFISLDDFCWQFFGAMH